MSAVAFQNFPYPENIVRRNREAKISRGDPAPIRALAVAGQFAVTVGSLGALHFWDLATGEFRWRFDPEPGVNWKGSVKIVDGKIIYSGPTVTEKGLERGGTIRVLDCKTGIETATIKDSQLLGEQVHAVGKRIFSILGDGNIGEWMMEGKFIRVIVSGNSPHFAPKLLGAKEILVHFFDNVLVIHNVRENDKKIIELAGEILDAHIDGGILTCGYRDTREKSTPGCSIIDLKEGRVIANYRLENLKGDDQGDVRKVIGNKRKAYLGLSSGALIAIDWDKKTHLFFGRHSSPIHQLALEGEVLVSSREGPGNQATMKFWNTSSMKEFSEIKLPAPLNVILTSSKVVTTTGSAIFIRNYPLFP